MTILVPTDFSEPSRVAVLYALRMAKKLKADVILLAVITMHNSAASSIAWNKLEEELIKISNQDAEKLMREVSEQVKDQVEITYRYVIGQPVADKIEAFAVDNEVDLIVMGTKGATGLEKVVMGTNAAAVIDNSSRPVIAVPAEASVMQIKKIVYASDLANLHDEIKTLALFAGLFNAAICVLHVLPEDSAKKMAIRKTTAELIRQANYPKISFHVAKGDHVAEAVDAFVSAQKADMVAMFTHKLDFYEKLFGRSVTRQMAFHARVPLLAFNKTTLL